MRLQALILLLLAATPAAADTIVLTDGTRQEGQVTFCDEETCVLSKQSLERTRIGLIVFLPEVALPPNVRGVVFEDGSVRGGNFSGLTLGYVELNGEEIDRERVAAIILEPLRPPPAETPQPPIVRPDDPPPAAPPQHEEPRRPSPAPPNVPPPAPAASPCGPGSAAGSGVAWSGSAKVRQTMGGGGYHHERNATLRVTLEEKCETALVDGSGRQIGSQVFIQGTAAQHEKYLDRQSMVTTCICEGEKTHTSSHDMVMIYRRTADGDTSRTLGFNLPPHRQPIYVMTLGGAGYIEAPCRGESCGGKGGGTMLQVSAGRVALGAGHWDPRERTVDGGIMRGTYTIPLGAATHQVSWSICRAGVTCPPPPEFEDGGGTTDTPERPPGEDPCGDMQQIRAPLDLAMDQQSLYLHQLQQLLQEHQRLIDQSEQWKGDFEHATRDCGLWSVAKWLTGFLATGGASGGEDIKHIKELWNFLGMLEKLSNGDPSWMLPNTEFGPDGKEWLSLEDAWDGFMIGYGQIDEGSPSSIKQDLQNCGAPTLHEVLDGAYEYLGLLEQIEPLARRMNEAANRVRDQDEMLYDKWSRYQSQCQEYQRCKGGSPAACDSWPPPGPIAPAPPPR